MKLQKFVLIFIAAIAVLFIIAIIIPSSPSSREEPAKPWHEMTYEDRDQLLNDFIKNKTLENADYELRKELSTSIANQCANPSTVSFTLQPSIYNGFANVVEADSGWIYVPFRCTAKNDFGIEKEIAGSVMFKYDGATNRLTVRDYDLSQNN